MAPSLVPPSLQEELSSMAAPTKKHGGLMAQGKEFSFFDVFADPKIVVYQGLLTDSDLSKPAAGGAVITESEVEDSQRYWYSPERVKSTDAFKLLPVLDLVVGSADAKRGEFTRLPGHDSRLGGFLRAWAGFKQEGLAELSAKMQEAAANVTIRLSPKCGQALDLAFASLEAGEDCIQTQKENSNLVCMRSAERLAHIRSLLHSAGNRKAQGDAILLELKSRSFKGASNETQLKTADPINKRLNILDKATSADVLEALKNMQYNAEGQLTCLSRWKIAHQLVTTAPTPQELKWVVLRMAGAIAAGTAADEPQKLVQEMFAKTKDRDTTLFDILLFEYQFVHSLCTEVKLPDDHPTKLKLETFLVSLPDYRNYAVWRAQQMRYQYGGFNIPALSGVLGLVEKAADGHMLKLFRASVTNFPHQKFTERVKDQKILEELKPVLDTWAMAFAPPKTEMDHVTVAVPGEEPLVPPEALKEKAKQSKVEQTADLESDSYLQLVVDPKDLESLKDLLIGKDNHEASVFTKGCPVATNSHCSPDHCRLLNLDPALENCPSAAFSKSQNPFWRSPGMSKDRLKYVMDAGKIFADTTKMTRDLWCISNSGHTRLTSQIVDGLNSFFDDRQSPSEVYILPKESSLQGRRDFSFKRKGERDRRSNNTLTKVAGKETWILAGATLPEVAHEYCQTEGFETTATPFLPIPLLDPKDLAPKVPMKEKMEIQDPTGDGRGEENISDGKPEMHVANSDPDSVVPLVMYGRHPAVCKEKLHMCRARSCVDFSPGDGQLALACVELRIPCLAICKSEKHRDVLKTYIRDVLKSYIQDKNNARFYRSSLQLGLPEDDIPAPQESKKESKKRKRESTSGKASEGEKHATESKDSSSSSS